MEEQNDAVMTSRQAPRVLDDAEVEAMEEGYRKQNRKFLIQVGSIFLVLVVLLGLVVYIGAK